MKKKITKADWVWMPHPAHFICAKDCRFFLATKVGNVIVSTVGEYFPDFRVREIYAKCRGIEIKGKGDEWDYNYMKKIGYEDLHIGGFKYETMVFKAQKMPKGEGCEVCPFRIVVSEVKDENWYKTAKEAYKGHYELCEKYSK